MSRSITIHAFSSIIVLASTTAIRTSSSSFIWTPLTTPSLPSPSGYPKQYRASPLKHWNPSWYVWARCQVVEYRLTSILYAALPASNS